MATPIDQLQDALNQLEAGQPAETAAAALPTEEAELLRLAAAVHSAPLPTLNADKLSAQRAALLRAVPSTRASAPARRPLWPWVAALSGAVVWLMACAVLVVGAAWWWAASPGGPLASQPNSTVASAGHSAIVQDVKGVVEVRAGDGSWRPTAEGANLPAGSRLRTGALSSAALKLPDGSLARLGPNTDLTLTTLDAPAGGPRVIRLFQATGDSDHVVAKSSDPAAIYEVATPMGAGRAKGTEFHVSVSAQFVTRFDVSEGVVAVTNVNVTVLVVAGQSTRLIADQPPAPPVFTFSGAGPVQQVGPAWIIAGQALQAISTTVVSGSPQVGDWAMFEGRQLADGSRVADRITLQPPALTNQFSFAGPVEAIAADGWTVAGRRVRVDALTHLAAELKVGDWAEVTGGVAADGVFWAADIHLFLDVSGAAPFSLTGVVQTISNSVWSVSGLTFTLDVSATVTPGLASGDLVQVLGRVAADGTRHAFSVQRLTTLERAFDFVGVVISLSPWNVSGVALTTDAQTQIDDDLRVGSRAHVRGRLLADGTWLAERIEQVDAGQRHAIQFTARVQSAAPWVVGGVTVTVTSQTKIVGSPRVGDLATVKGSLAPDGSVVAKTITRVAEARGCVTNAALVNQITTSAITLLGGPTIPLTGSVPITGEVKLASVINLTLCQGDDGQFTVISIVVIFQLEALPATPTPGPSPSPSPAPTATVVSPAGGPVTICHIPPGNPKKRKTLTVAAGEVAGHLQHGDTLGPCEKPGKKGDHDD